jgi:hypothetical protein
MLTGQQPRYNVPDGHISPVARLSNEIDSIRKEATAKPGPERVQRVAEAIFGAHDRAQAAITEAEAEAWQAAKDDRFTPEARAEDIAKALTRGEQAATAALSEAKGAFDSLVAALQKQQALPAPDGDPVLNEAKAANERTDLMMELAAVSANELPRKLAELATRAAEAGRAVRLQLLAGENTDWPQAYLRSRGVPDEGVRELIRKAVEPFLPAPVREAGAALRALTDGERSPRAALALAEHAARMRLTELRKRRWF